MKIKKILSALCTLLLLAGVLVSCSSDKGSSVDNVGGGNGGGASTSSKKFYINYNSVKIEVGADATKVITSLGSNYTSQEGEVCGFDEKDIVYTYGGLEITSHKKGTSEKITKIKLLNDSVKTPEGITIGSSKDAVISAYGSKYTSSGENIRYTSGTSVLEVYLSNDKVTNLIIKSV